MPTRFSFAIDRGGTFTDVYAEIYNDDEKHRIILKLLSQDPSSYSDAPTEAIRRVLQKYTNKSYPKGEPLDTSLIDSIRMGTTVATNALLERKGERMAFVTTVGFHDLLRIGNQSRPRIFDLEIVRPDLLYDEVIEIDERIVPVGNVDFRIDMELNEERARVDMKRVYDNGIRSLAICLMHSYSFHKHELILGSIASEIGFTNISLSHKLMPMVKMVPRAHTSCADAYLTPCLQQYLLQFRRGFDTNLLDNVSLLFMQSDGGLTRLNEFHGFKAILSGPAGGVVGYANTTPRGNNEPLVGFDMGGTSTDVSRYSGMYEHVFETTTAGVSIQAPQLDINTVAAGGGSILTFQSGLFQVGPQSAGALPGPTCYRKGGPLTVTDANLLLGRLYIPEFPCIFGENQDEPLDFDATKKAFEILTNEINAYHSDQPPRSIYDVAYGFICVANEAMCRPIRALTQARGYSITNHILVCFGGAGPQHACAIARNLGIRRVFVHQYAPILSAYGMALAPIVYESQEPCALIYNNDNMNEINEKLKRVSKNAVDGLVKQRVDPKTISTIEYLNMRYVGTDTALMITLEGQKHPHGSYVDVFIRRYKREFGFCLDRDVRIDDVRVRAISHTPKLTVSNESLPDKSNILDTCTTYFFNQKHNDTIVIHLKNAAKIIKGPAILLDETNTIIIEPDCTAERRHDGIMITIGDTNEVPVVTITLDPIQLSIFSHRFMSIAEQMGRTLQRTSISTNIKERLDFSCALFGDDGGLVANAPHLPVHLGAMQEAVKFQVKIHGNTWHDGDVIMSNHPQAGGSHLPDITVITPVFSNDGSVIFFVASRGHHADIGGISPGSMPPFSKNLSEEGAAIVSFKLVNNGVFDEDGVSKILHGTRNLSDNLSDLKAQVAANNKGIALVQELVEQYTLPVVQAYMLHIRNNAEIAVREMLYDISIQHGMDEVDSVVAYDYMDDGSCIQLKLTINRQNRTAIFDFTGTGPQIHGNTNAPPAVTYSAIIYCLRCLVKHDIPLNQGCLNPIAISIPKGCLLNPSEDAAVVGGNVLTSQRVTDVVLKAFGACAASQGCMNNLTFGDDTFGYYETIAGGAGAGPTWNGASGVHTHMTNTRITDPEIFERRYPVILREFGLRKDGSGGKGRYNGGEGVIREIEFLKPLSIGILSERRSYKPYGLNGGEDGKCGQNVIIHNECVINLGGKNTYSTMAGDRLRILSPGGGGYGQYDDNNNNNSEEKQSIPLIELKTQGSLSNYNQQQLSV